jgi:xanthine dehydrogenase YagS FAD-binding subunit
VCRKKGGSRCFAAKGRNKYHAIFGGGICYIVHPSDLAPALIALSARAIIVSANGERVLALQDFFALPAANVRKENVLAPDEVLKEVVLPPAEKGDRSTYDKFKERGTWDFAVVSVAAKISLSGSAAREIRIVLGGVAPVPWALKKASSILNGKKLTETLLRQAIAEELAEAKPLAENGYKKELVAALVPRAVLSLVSA